MERVLDGIRVIDVTRFFAGPYCGMLLGDYGADVIKVESLEGDTQREQGPPFVGKDLSTGFMAANRNKKSIAINLKTEEGKEIILDLIKKADVFIENFRNGVADRMGLGFEALKKINPSIVYCSISGYGSKGPYAENPAFDHTVQAYSGFMSMNGLSGGEPVKPAISIVDMVAGVYAFSGVMSALFKRERSKTKEAQWVKTSLLESITSYFTDAAVTFLLNGTVRGAMGSHHANLAPYGAFKAQDGYLVIGAGHSHIWKKFCELLGMTELLTDLRFSENGPRWENRAALAEILEKEFQATTVEELVTKLLEAGIPAAPVNTIGQALSSEQIKSMDMIVQLTHPTLGEMKLLGPAVKQPGMDIGRWTAPPVLGEHTRNILSEDLHIPEDKINELLDAKVIRAAD